MVGYGLPVSNPAFERCQALGQNFLPYCIPDSEIAGYGSHGSLTLSGVQAVAAWLLEMPMIHWSIAPNSYLIALPALGHNFAFGTNLLESRKDINPRYVIGGGEIQSSAF